MIQIAFLEESSKIGGAEINVLNLLENLDSNKFDTLVICPEEGPLSEKIREIKGKVVIITKIKSFSTSTEIFGAKIFNPFATTYNLFSFFPNAVKIAKFIKSEKIDILHTNSMLAHFYGGIASKIAHCKCIWHVQDIVDPNLGFGIVKKVFDLAGKRLADRIIVVSRAVSENFEDNNLIKTFTIYNGTNLFKYNPNNYGIKIREEFMIPTRQVVVGIVGRIASWKGHEVFLNAAKIIHEKYLDIRFMIVGGATYNSNYLQKLSRLTKNLALERNVIFTGFREDIPEIIAALDICVHASILPDPCPLVVLDYMAAGKPLVATNGGGIPEIVKDSRTGKIVPMKDKDALAKAILELIENPQLMKSLGKAGRVRVETHFSNERFIENMSKQYLELYGEY